MAKSIIWLESNGAAMPWSFVKRFVSVQILMDLTIYSISFETIHSDCKNFVFGKKKHAIVILI